MTQKPGEDTVGLPGEHGSGISPTNHAPLPVPIYLFDFWGGGQRRDEKHKSRGSREKRIFSVGWFSSSKNRRMTERKNEFTVLGRSATRKKSWIINSQCIYEASPRKTRLIQGKVV